MIFSRGPLMRFFIALWCMFGCYVVSADALLLIQHHSDDILVMAEETETIDVGRQTGTAEIRVPHISASSAYALRNPIRFDKQSSRPGKYTFKPRRLSHIEYCGRKMVRAIMLQFHPRDGGIA